MSEFNIKQANRNRYNANKLKKQNFKRRENVKVTRNHVFDGGRTSESSDGSGTSSDKQDFSQSKTPVDVHLGANQELPFSYTFNPRGSVTSETFTSEVGKPKRKRVRKRKSASEKQDSSQNESADLSSQDKETGKSTVNSLFTQMKNDQPKKKPATPKNLSKYSVELSADQAENQQRKQNKTPNQSASKFTSSSEKPKKKPDFPRMATNPQKSSSTHLSSEKPKKKPDFPSMATNPNKSSFQWFAQSAENIVDNQQIFNKSSDLKKPLQAKTHQPKVQSDLTHSPRGQFNKKQAKSVPFTTAGMHREQLQTVKGFFAGAMPGKNVIDSDLASKYDCSKTKGRNECFDSDLRFQKGKNRYFDSGSQPSFQPFPQSMLEKELFNDQENVKKYEKRPINRDLRSNNYLPDYEEANEQKGENFDDLCKATFSVSSHFLLKEQKEWIEQAKTSVNPFSLDLKILASGLETVAFHQRHTLPENSLSSDELSRMASEAKSRVETYEKIKLEAEEDKNPVESIVSSDINDDIFKDELIGDFLARPNSSNKASNDNVGEVWSCLGKNSADTLRLGFDEKQPISSLSSMAFPQADEKSSSRLQDNNHNVSLSPSLSQSSDKRSRGARGYSAFNITESLSDILAEKSDSSTLRRKMEVGKKMDVLDSELSLPSRPSPLDSGVTSSSSSPLQGFKFESLQKNLKDLKLASSPSEKSSSLDFTRKYNSAPPVPKIDVCTPNSSQVDQNIKPEKLSWKKKTAKDFVESTSNNVSNSKPMKLVIEDNEVDSLLGLTKTPSLEIPSREPFNNTCLGNDTEGKRKTSENSTSDFNDRSSTSIIDEDLDDWLDSYLES